MILSRKLEKMELKKREKQQTYKDLYSIDGKPYIIDKDEINFKSNEIMKKVASKSLAIDFASVGHEKSFYNWILEKNNCKNKYNSSCLSLNDPEASNCSRKSLNLVNAHMKVSQSSIQRFVHVCTVHFHKNERLRLRK